MLTGLITGPMLGATTGLMMAMAVLSNSPTANAGKIYYGKQYYFRKNMF